MSSEGQDLITYPFPQFYGCTVMASTHYLYQCRPTSTRLLETKIDEILIELFSFKKTRLEMSYVKRCVVVYSPEFLKADNNPGPNV